MEKNLEDIFSFDEIQDDCVKCGKCIPVCTIHIVNPDEVKKSVSRGFKERSLASVVILIL